MPKTAVAAALAALILAAVTPTAQAMPVAPHHSVFAGSTPACKMCNGGAAGATAGGGCGAGPAGATAGGASAAVDAAEGRVLK